MTTQLQRTWVQSDHIARKNNFWRDESFEDMSEFLVELTTDNRDKFTVIELVTASCIEHAVWVAFQTRNISQNWIVTEVERFEHNE